MKFSNTDKVENRTINLYWHSLNFLHIKVNLVYPVIPALGCHRFEYQKHSCFIDAQVKCHWYSNKKNIYQDYLDISSN